MSIVELFCNNSLNVMKAGNKKNKIALQNEKYFEVPGHDPEIEGSKEKRREMGEEQYGSR